MMQISFFSDLKAWDFMHTIVDWTIYNCSTLYLYPAIENSERNEKMLEDNCIPRESPLLIVKDVWDIPQM